MQTSWLMSVMFVFGLAMAAAQQQPLGATWQPSDPGFRAVAIASSAEAFWVAGPGESIASSPDGQKWTSRHTGPGGALLLGIHFSSDSFGYAFGTSGTLLTTQNGGVDWTTRRLSDEPILMAALSDPGHGLIRTRSALLVLNGDGPPLPIQYPLGVEKRFPFTAALAALTQDKMVALLSEGPHSEGGFLATQDGGKSWTFYDPPSTGISDLTVSNGLFWTTGHEVVGKDQPGGGHSVPMAMSSDDGVRWTRTTNNIKPCHWESCGVCQPDGCLASGNLLVNFFDGPTSYLSIPAGKLTARWSAAGDILCTINDGIYCVRIQTAHDADAQPDVPQPSPRGLPPLGSPVNSSAILRCLSCALEPVYVDEKVHGQFQVHLALHVRADGTVESVKVEGAPSKNILDQLHNTILQWLFEPPQQDGKPVQVDSQNKIAITVMSPR